MMMMMMMMINCLLSLTDVLIELDGLTKRYGFLMLVVFLF